MQTVLHCSQIAHLYTHTRAQITAGICSLDMKIVGSITLIQRKWCSAGRQLEAKMQPGAQRGKGGYNQCLHLWRVA